MFTQKYGWCNPRKQVQKTICAVFGTDMLSLMVIYALKSILVFLA